MIDALLFGVKHHVLVAAWGYGPNSVDIRVDGRPPPSAGDFFLAIHETGSQSLMDNALDEYFAFDLTLTQRVTVPLDRLGDQELAKKLARQPGPQGQPSFNARLEQLRAHFHMNWMLLQTANNLISDWTPSQGGVALQYQPSATPVYGFCEPPRYRGLERPHFESGTWFAADPEAEEVGLVGSLHFDDCRRLQALQTFV